MLSLPAPVLGTVAVESMEYTGNRNVKINNALQMSASVPLGGAALGHQYLCPPGL